jgi:hypothetical protein
MSRRLRGVWSALAAGAAVAALPLAAPPASAASTGSASSQRALSALIAHAAKVTARTKSLHISAKVVTTIDGKATTIMLSGGEVYRPIGALLTETVNNGKGSSTTFSVIYDGPGIYVKPTEPAGSSPTWYFVPLTQVGYELAVGGSGALNFTSSLPQDAKSITKVRQLGTQSVNGKMVTRYRATITAQPAVSTATGGGFSNSLLGHFSSAVGTRALTVQLWIDRSHRIVQLSVSEPISHRYLAKVGEGAATFGTLRISMNFSQFGGGAFVVPPPASQVQPLSTSTPSAASAGSGAS